MEFMQAGSQPIVKDLVLVGGGHSHAIALKLFGMKPLPGVRITLISDVVHTPYSGMLPGYIAGLYTYDECHIDLRPLANFAQAQLIVDKAIGLDLVNNRVLCANHAAIGFDLLSIDIGSTPTVSPVPGALEHTTPVKPISKFLNYWDELVHTVAQFPDRPLRIGIVGGGAGGVELALSAQAHLSRIYQKAGQPASNLTMHLFHRGERLLPKHNAAVGQKVEAILADRGVQLHLGETVESVQPELICCQSGLAVNCDRIFWVTQASAAPWLKAAGLATDENGFIQLTDTLQSVSHPHIFAAGDIATMVNHPRPKAGVFAVRQGQPLYNNLRRALLEQPLKPFVPQKKYLILVGTGTESAIASRGFLTVGQHPLLWRWKDRIDRRFMQKFSDLGNMGETDQQTQISSNSLPVMHCAGCASKVGSSVLERALDRLRQEQLFWVDRDDVLIGLDAPDDAAAVSVPPGKIMVQTVDYFRALLADPFLLGQIVTHHCLSDIFAMGASPQSVMAIATLPYATAAKLEETLYQLLAGTAKALIQANATLIGGHTTEGADLAFGLACNGLADPKQLWRKSGMQPGQVLILTKALGTGTLFAADMRLKAKGRWIESAIQSMLVSNGAAAQCFRQHQATSCTDITGFGLMGHLVEMIRAAQVSVELDFAALPLLDGASETIAQGILSSLHPQNLNAANYIESVERVSDRPLFPVLFDPQTSGGLLASVPPEQASACLTALQAQGYPQSRVIGRVLSPATQPTVRIK
jgi:selenide, water dikinase